MIKADSSLFENTNVEPTKLTIIHRDDNITVINKSAGMLVHRSKATSSREPSVCMYIREMYKCDAYPVHRLDRATSGILVFANSHEDARFIGNEWKTESTKKEYIAIVRGWTNDALQIDHPLSLMEDTEKKQEAFTQLQTLARIELPFEIEKNPSSRYSLVELCPVTGRRHQLRRHMKHIHHPIIGDTAYGRGAHNRFFRQHFSCERLLLHAQKITFKHPVGDIKTFTALPDESMTRIIRLLFSSVRS